MSVQYDLPDPPTDAISAVKFAPKSSRMLVSSWDKFVYLYDTAPPSGQLLSKFEHRAPVLDVCFGENENVAYTAGVDHACRRIDLTTSDQKLLSTHAAGVRSVAYSPSHNILISASWDCTLHVHRLTDTSQEPLKIMLPNKPFSLSTTATKLVVAMSARTVHIYELSSLAANDKPEPWQRRESSLKFMTRAVSCMPTDLGYASGSIEGRVAVEWFDPSTESQARKYAFKCHRLNPPEGDEGGDIVYPVNALAFHPTHGTFASGGGDGIVALWDGLAKRRIRQYQRYSSSVAALGFSGDGKYLAIATCPGFEDGKEAVGEGEIKIHIRGLADGEAKGKGAK
ncbi:uncharacterized protein KY384_007685 [Bacidia gigantensis]|uniref:uncharacterized protein n=1 Tax=Bacidia gigantensis TaxID=2732470 RepID=UPI001D049719|nr:uncharacterized protein KY384_007685 [Bacidia gigantensis]KAG8527533.1 hypothetical protein KY384_007685 [Bacidia gigantensis]